MLFGKMRVISDGHVQDYIIEEHVVRSG